MKYNGKALPATYRGEFSGYVGRSRRSPSLPAVGTAYTLRMLAHMLDSD
jgi:hypothetical protein